MRSRNGVNVMSTSDSSSPRKYAPGVFRSSASTTSRASSNWLRFPPSAHDDVSHRIQRENNARSSRFSSSTRATAAVPRAGRSGVRSGNRSSSAAAIAALSVMRSPSISTTGSIPLGTFDVNDAGLSP
jgi:hypothetical protein